MRTRLSIVGAVVLAALGLVFACADSPNAPVTQLPDSIVSGGDHALLVALLAKLNSVQASLDSESRVSQGRFDSLTKLLDSLAARGDTGSSAPSPFDVEAKMCVNADFGPEGEPETELMLRGGAEGMLGADVYGNGAKGRVLGTASEDAKVGLVGSVKLAVEVCGVHTGDIAASVGGTAPARGGSRAAAGNSSPVQTYLTNLLQSVSTDQLTTAVGRLGMDGPHLASAVDAVSTFSLSDLRFGQGAGAALLNSLPLPSDIMALLENPSMVLQDAGQAAQFAVSRVCDQTLFTGSFAQRAADACNLKDQIPSASALIGILQGLNGLPATLGTLQNEATGACTAVNAMRPARVTIPPQDVSFPLGIGTIRVFPGYDQALFPGVAAIC